MVSVFGEPSHLEESNDQYSAFLNTSLGSGQVYREDFTIDASAYERKIQGEDIDPKDLALISKDSGRSAGHELEAEMQLSGLLDEMEAAPIEAWHSASSAQNTA